jgi:hypothetical protein
VSDPDLLTLIRQIHAEEFLLRSVAREADVEVAAIAASTRRNRERLSRERYDSRSRRRAGERGEDRQIGMQPNPVQSPNAKRR